MTGTNPSDRPKTRKWLKRLLLGSAAAITTIVVVLIILWRTMILMPGVSYAGELPAADDSLRKLAAELRGDVSKLAAEIGERNVGQRPKQLAQAAQWIEQELTKAGYKPRRQKYAVSGVQCANLEAVLPGTSKPAEIVVVGAHYDSALDAPGANDNGSGMAGVLALARRFAKRPQARTLRFVAFVNEEPPYFQTARMGSLVYARECRQRGDKVVAMLCLETIGYYDDTAGSQKYPPVIGSFYPSEGNFIGFVGNAKSADLVRRAVDTFRANEKFPAEGGVFPEALPGVGYSDHWSFWHEGYPGVMITDTAMFRYPYYHTPQDTPDKVNFDRTARVVRGLEGVVETVAQGR